MDYVRELLLAENLKAYYLFPIVIWLTILTIQVHYYVTGLIHYKNI